jgi:hypothetical protein
MRRFLAEPLVHFLAIGAALFLLGRWVGDSAGAAPSKVVVTRAQVDALESGFFNASQRLPTDDELDALVQDYVKEEVSVREALALGLDRGDAVVRQRLRQKFEFLNEDSVETAEPTEDGLRAYLAAHPEAFRIEGRLPELSDVRDSVERQWRADQRRERLDARYRTLLSRYEVVVEGKEKRP